MSERPVPRENWPRRAAGVLVFAENTGRVLLLNRADGSGWSHPGGWSEAGEEPAETALRELDEETGFPGVLLESLHVLVIGVSAGRYAVLPRPSAPKPDLEYVLFVTAFREEFVPRLDGEHTAFTWADPDDLGPHLHPGCRLALDALRKAA